MRKVIVTTTINAPTEAIRRFDAMADWQLVVIGDKKTPPSYKLARGIYVGPEEQEAYDKGLSDAVGWNCIQRRNFGLLWAHDLKADIVAVVDDDNIPYEHWGKDLLLGRQVETAFYETALPAFDPVGATNERKIWHRGYPLQLIPQRDYSKCSRRAVTAAVQADFWDGDPDVDAICRMEHAPECKFDPACFPIAGSAISPFNSQNTFLLGDVLEDYFLYPHVGRMDDIWAAYYVQAKGRKVVYGAASVFQARNVHDLVKDMKQEYVGYENNLTLVKEIVTDPDAILAYLPGRSVRAWQLYRRHFGHA
jgi:hypothetical protein